MSNLNFKSKYLKYKQKYLELKEYSKQVGGMLRHVHFYGQDSSKPVIEFGKFNYRGQEVIVVKKNPENIDSGFRDMGTFTLSPSNIPDYLAGMTLPPFGNSFSGLQNGFDILVNSGYDGPRWQDLNSYSTELYNTVNTAYKNAKTAHIPKYDLDPSNPIVEFAKIPYKTGRWTVCKVYRDRIPGEPKPPLFLISERTMPVILKKHWFEYKPIPTASKYYYIAKKEGDYDYNWHVPDAEFKTYLESRDPEVTASRAVTSTLSSPSLGPPLVLTPPRTPPTVSRDVTPSSIQPQTVRASKLIVPPPTIQNVTVRATEPTIQPQTIRATVPARTDVLALDFVFEVVEPMDDVMYWLPGLELTINGNLSGLEEINIPKNKITDMVQRFMRRLKIVTLPKINVSYGERYFALAKRFELEDDDPNVWTWKPIRRSVLSTARTVQTAQLFESTVPSFERAKTESVYVETYDEDRLNDICKLIEDKMSGDVQVFWDIKKDQRDRPYLLIKYVDRDSERSHLTIHLRQGPRGGTYELGPDTTATGAIHVVSGQEGDEYRTPIKIDDNGVLHAITDQTAEAVRGAPLLARHASYGTRAFTDAVVEALNEYGIIHF